VINIDTKKIILESNITLDSDVPLYYQLISIIKRNISMGTIKQGDVIPSEKELCDAFGISRSTVRQAIGELEEEGLVIRRRGLGTYICEPKMRRSLNDVYSFTKDMNAMGLLPSSLIQSFRVIYPSDDVSGAFDIKHSDKQVYEIVRLRCANGQPLLLETTFIPLYILPELKKADLISGSLYGILKQRSGVYPDVAEETYETTLVDEATSKLLHCKADSCGFYVERRTWDKTGILYELTQSVIRGDKTKFVLKLKKDKVSWDRNFEGFKK